MKQFLHILAALALLLCISCSNDSGPDPADDLWVSSTSIDFAEHSNTRVVIIRTGHSWTLTPDRDWITTPKQSGKGSDTLFVSVPQNNTGAVRTGSLSLAVEGEVVTINVSQRFSQDITDKIPDPAFFSFCMANYDRDGDGILMSHEVSGITSMDINNRQIEDITGLEYFVSLSTLDCSGNPFETLPLGNLTSLTSLTCQNMANLIMVDVTSCRQITSVNCSNSAVAGIVTRNCTRLQSLRCNNTEVATLDISENRSLSYLNANGCEELKVIFVWNDFDPSLVDFSVPDDVLFAQK